MITVDEYLEKTAGVFGTTAAKMIGDAVKSPWMWGGVATLGALGATGALGALEGESQGETMSYRMNRGLNSLYDRIRADETAATSFATSLGKNTAENLIGLTQDMVTKGLETMKDTYNYSPARKAIFSALKKEDEYLAGADNKHLLEAYHTMSKVAPTLSTDKNAVKSFLREAVISGGGLDFNTIKGIAEAENAVTGRHSKGAKK